MHTDQETTRIVRSWLEEGRTALPDHVLDGVLEHLPATQQRRPLWRARRIAPMNPYAKLIAAAAAVLVVAVVGINLLGVGMPEPGVPGPSPSASTPSRSSSPSAPPTPTLAALTAPPTPPLAAVTGPLEAGTYRIIQPGHTLRPFRFTVPAGWLEQPDPGGPVSAVGASRPAAPSFADPMCRLAPIGPDGLAAFAGRIANPGPEPG